MSAIRTLPSFPGYTYTILTTRHNLHLMDGRFLSMTATVACSEMFEWEDGSNGIYVL